MELVVPTLAAASAVAILRRRKVESEADPTHILSKFGYSVRRSFPTDFTFTHLNHGSYGVSPYAVMNTARDIMLRIEGFPDHFFRRTGLPSFLAAADKIASFLDAAPGSVVFVDNATVAVNTVLRTMAFDEADGVLITDNTYNAVKNAVYDRAGNTKAKVVSYTVNIAQVVAEGEESLVKQFARVLDANPHVRLAILDHITSPTALIMPVARMVVEAHIRGVRVLVDGAHAPGQLPLSMKELGADWYVGNLHKWCYTLKGVAALYVAPEVQAMTQGPVISHFWKKSMGERFWMQGTNEQSRYLSAPFALEWVDQELGGWERVRRYNGTLAREGASLLCEAWGTERMLPESLCAPFLVVVETPLDLALWVRRTLPDGSTMANCYGCTAAQVEAAAMIDEGLNERVAMAVFNGWRIQSQFFSWPVAGRLRLWCRISAQVYNVMDDYKALAKAVMALHEADNKMLSS